VKEDAVLSKTDGRVHRRIENRDRVLMSAVRLFSQGVWPTHEEVSTASGLSLRSIYRYFETTDQLILAAIHRSYAVLSSFNQIPNLGRGDLDSRIVAFVDLRLDVYKRTGTTYRMVRQMQDRHTALPGELLKGRLQHRLQTQAHFAEEIKAGVDTTALDILVTPESLDYFTMTLGLTLDETKITIVKTFRQILRIPEKL